MKIQSFAACSCDVVSYRYFDGDAFVIEAGDTKVLFFFVLLPRKMKTLPFCFLGESANPNPLTRCNIPQNIALRKIDFDRTVNVASLECHFMALHDIYQEDASRTVSAFSVLEVVIITTSTTTTTTTSTAIINTTQGVSSE